MNRQSGERVEYGGVDIAWMNIESCEFSRLLEHATTVVKTLNKQIDSHTRLSFYVNLSLKTLAGTVNQSNNQKNQPIKQLTNKHSVVFDICNSNFRPILKSCFL